MSNTLITKKGRNQKHDIIEEIHNYNLCIDTREIFLHGEPGEENTDAGVDFRMANRFLKNIKFLEAAGDDPIIVHQHSIGGDWSSGMMIYDIIASCQCHIIFVMHGDACSMGSIIPQAADTRIIMPNCIFMIHEGYDNLDGTHRQIVSATKVLDKLREQMLDIYVSVCINGHFFQREQADDKKVKQYLIDRMSEKEDWWLTAREAVTFGFADAVLGDEGYDNIDQIRNSIINGDE
jgi:ATP-dependent protease ClpP protease subunit